MKLDDFDFHLPETLIATRPARPRSSARLLLADGDATRDLHVHDLADLLGPGDLLVLNDTKVIPARLFGAKATGGRVEILIERLLAPDEALAQVRASKAPKSGRRLDLGGGEQLEVLGRDEGLYRLRALGSPFPVLMEAQGHIPLPPYIDRPDDAADTERYQTIYGHRPGAVAAPTAGLHFDTDLLARLDALGVGRAEVTLHVGAGTFQPVRVDDLDEHRMHAEWLEVDESVCERIAATRAAGGRVVAVGTTSVRSLETAAADGELRPFRGDSRLFIRPGYRFRVVDAMVTNFHLPESTLLMLVSAFAGVEPIRTAYRHAVAARYRFFSYGDAMFLTHHTPD